MVDRTTRLLTLALCLLTFHLSARLSVAESSGVHPGADKPNILLIPVDDLNDWIGVLGGHPQAVTPHIDALAERGVAFTNAHCQSPVCNPSRSSMLTSLYPETTGLYFLNPWPTASERLMQNTFLMDRFQEEGYAVSGAGKIFHGGQNPRFVPNYGGGVGGFGPVPEEKLTDFPGHKFWDWGVYPEKEEDMPDFQVAAWAVERLKQDAEQEKPFLLGVGFYRPHVPLFAPREWFDRFALEEVVLPEVIAEDLADLSQYAIDLTRLEHVAPTYEWVRENDEWKRLVQSYLACVSFVDDQVGKVLTALEASGQADNTIIVLFSDHGFALGEKERFAKRSLWENTTRVPLIIAGPGIEEGVLCSKPVELIDVYPTLLELAGLPPDPGHEGQSLVPLLRDARADWPHMARTSFGPGNLAIRSEHFRYIRYADGSEEFYDHRNDPHEWHNLITAPEFAEEIQRHREHLPQNWQPSLEANSTGHKAYRAAGLRAGLLKDSGEAESEQAQQQE